MQPAIVKTDKYTRYRLAHKRGGWRSNKKIPTISDLNDFDYAPPGFLDERLAAPTEPTDNSGKGGFYGEPKGNVIFAYEHPDKIVLMNIAYSVCNKKLNSSKTVYVFKEKDKKFNLYKIKSTGTVGSIPKFRNISNNPTQIKDLFLKFKNGKVAKGKINKIVLRFLKDKNPYMKEKKFALKAMVLSCYPALNDLNGFCQIPNEKYVLSSCYSGCFRQPTFKKAMKKCFGSSGNALFQELIKQAPKYGFESFVIGSIFKNILSLDYLLSLIKMTPKLSENKLLTYTIPQSKQIKEYRLLLKQFNKDRLKILIDGDLRNLFRNDFRDSAKMYAEYKDKVKLPEKPKDFHEIHEDLSRQIRRIKVELQAITQEKLQKLDGVSVNPELTFILPKTNHELLDWGEQMHNCIGGYWTSVQSGHTNVLGVNKGGVLTYNIEINRDFIRQFVTKFNQKPDPIDEKIIRDYLTSNKICASVSYNTEVI